jgi:Spy/CpxP family protein refolding chaperone
MNRKAVLLVAVVFVLGLILGGLSTHLAADRLGVGHQKGGRDSSRTVEELTREMNLTPDQQKQLAATLDETRGKYQAIYEQYRPQIEQVRREGRQKIRSFLTEEQLPKFEAWLQRIDEARRKKNGR